jgi:two-component system sensor histidine kinase ChiS
MDNTLALSYQLPDTLVRLSHTGNADSAALFMEGTAAGFLIICALYRLWVYGRLKKGSIPVREYQCRIAALVLIFCSALGLSFPFIPGFSRISILAASLIQLLGLLGFQLSLALLLFIHHFPNWGIKQLLPLPLLTLITALLPLSGQLTAPLGLGSFSLAQCCLFLGLFIYTIRQKQSGWSFLWISLQSLMLGLSFLLPLGRGAFFWPAVLLVYLLLEHRLFPQDASVLGPLFLPMPEPVLEEEGPVMESGPAAETEEAEIPDELIPLAEDEAAESPVAENPGAESSVADVPPEAAEAESPAAPANPSTSFIPKEFLAILNKKSVADLKLGDHIKQEMTIFFSDIRQFTDLSENLTPEESFAFINSYLSRIVPEITKNGGFVDKYIGDAVLALFPQAQGPDMAVRTAISIQGKILEYNIHRAKCGYRPLSMGIGIHTGTLMVGVVGTKDRMQSTVISDAVNLASRVESLTKAFRVSLAISEETFKKLENPGSYQYRFVGKVRVKGKSEPVSIFEIFDGIDENLQKQKIKANRFFEQGMFMYYQRKYSDALQEFRRVLELLPGDGAAAFYIDNCMTKI